MKLDVTKRAIARNITMVSCDVVGMTSLSVFVDEKYEHEFSEWCKEQGFSANPITIAGVSHFILVLLTPAQVLMVKLAWGGADAYSS